MSLTTFYNTLVTYGLFTELTELSSVTLHKWVSCVVIAVVYSCRTVTVIFLISDYTGITLILK